VSLLRLPHYFNKKLHTPNTEKPDNIIPDHLYHWGYDKGCSTQLKRIPFASLLAFRQEIKVLAEISSATKAAKQGNGYKVAGRRLFHELEVPVSIHCCELEDFVRNDTLKEVYECLDESKREFIFYEQTEHMPTYDAIKAKEVIGNALTWMGKHE